MRARVFGRLALMTAPVLMWACGGDEMTTGAVVPTAGTAGMSVGGRAATGTGGTSAAIAGKSGTGGTSSSAGVSAAGAPVAGAGPAAGAANRGGSTSQGGSIPGGGATATGGTQNAGGLGPNGGKAAIPSTGGTATAGGASVSGGTPAAAGTGGGTVSAGGQSAAGTSSSTGGSTPSAGAPSAGAPSTGGNPSAGGSPSGGTGGAAGSCSTYYYLDGDDDTWGGTTVACSPGSTGSWVTRDGDCDDGNGDVHPNQQTFFAEPYEPSGGGQESFDYDCDGNEELQGNTTASTGTCAEATTGNACEGTGYLPVEPVRTGDGVENACGSTRYLTCQNLQGTCTGSESTAAAAVCR